MVRYGSVYVLSGSIINSSGNVDKSGFCTNGSDGSAIFI